MEPLDVASRCAIGTFLYDPLRHEPLNGLVSEIFSIKVADTETDRQTHIQTDPSAGNKGRLKLSGRASQ